jgi:mevalonate kinase
MTHSPLHPRLLSGQSIKASSAGKLILFGEHSVVYGSPAIACALEQGLYAEARYQPQLPYSILYLVDWDVECKADPQGDRLAQAFAVACHYTSLFYQEKTGHSLEYLPSLLIHIKGPLPFKVGLGSSAALSIAVLKVLSQALQLTLKPHDLHRGAWAMESIFHTTPSGLDHSVALSGGIQAFQKLNKATLSKATLSKATLSKATLSKATLSKAKPNKSSQQKSQNRLKQGPNSIVSIDLPSIKLEPIQFPNTLYLAISWTERQGGTAEAVAHVKCLYEQSDEAKNHIEQLGKIAQSCIHHCRQGELFDLATHINKAHKHLVALNLSIDTIESYIKAHKREGALAAKMTGAGFGGAMFALYPDLQTRSQAIQTLKQQNINFWAVNL